MAVFAVYEVRVNMADFYARLAQIKEEIEKDPEYLMDTIRGLRPIKIPINGDEPQDLKTAIYELNHAIDKFNAVLDAE